MRHNMLTLSGALGNCIDLFFVVCSGVITSSKFHLICISHVNSWVFHMHLSHIFLDLELQKWHISAFCNVAVVMFYFVIA